MPSECDREDPSGAAMNRDWVEAQQEKMTQMLINNINN
jgi:hypothetical protein